MQQRPQRRGATRPGGSRRARLLGAVAVLALAALAGPLLPFAATPALAAGPNAITLAFDGAKPFTVRAETEPELFATLLNEVQWLTTGPGRVTGVERAKLGPKVAMTVLVNDVAKHGFDLYPLAVGGPRACRPGKQPDGKRPGGDAWFLARLTLPDALRAAGVPLNGGPQLFAAGGGNATGGMGGGSAGSSTDQHNGPSFTRVGDFAEVVGAWRQVLLLNGAVVLVIAAGLGGIAWLIRRKV